MARRHSCAAVKARARIKICVCWKNNPSNLPQGGPASRAGARAQGRRSAPSHAGTEGVILTRKGCRRGCRDARPLFRFYPLESPGLLHYSISGSSSAAGEHFSRAFSTHSHLRRCECATESPDRRRFRFPAEQRAHKPAV